MWETASGSRYYHNKHMKQGKKYRSVLEKVEDKAYSASDALEFMVANTTAKFDESVEVHMHLNIDPKKGDQQIRGTIVLPNGTGKQKKVAVITSTAQKEAKSAGADIVGGEELIEEIKSGKFFALGCDILVATPEMMPKLAPMAKILGPKGMMPSPKTETVTMKVKETVEALRKGKVNFKNDNTGNIHQAIGKISFGAEKLKENYDAFLEVILKSKPASVKGKFVVSIGVCSTMSPGIRVA